MSSKAAGPGFSFPRNRVVGLVGAGIWLAYMQSAFGEVWQASGWSRVFGVAALIGFCLVYLVGMVTVTHFASENPSHPGHPALAWGYLALLVLLALAAVPTAGDRTTVCAVFIAAAAIVSLRLPPAIVLVLVLFAAVEASARLVPGWSDHGNGFAVLLAAAAVGFMRTALLRARALRAAQQELADAAVAEERTRIAQDLHDILGHSLSVITLKAELAQRLFDVDTDKARSELAALETLSRDALADVRSTALGVRGISLAGEVAAARQALDSASIEATLPTTTDEVPTSRRELFAWIIRESVTNVIRHSRATRCEVEMSASRVSVADDGVGMPVPPPLGGHGLSGLRARCESAGAAMTTMTGLDKRGLRVLVECGDE